MMKLVAVLYTLQLTGFSIATVYNKFWSDGIVLKETVEPQSIRKCEKLFCGGLCKEVKEGSCSKCLCSDQCPYLRCAPGCTVDYSGSFSWCPRCVCEGEVASQEIVLPLQRETDNCPPIECGGLCRKVVESPNSCPKCICSVECKEIHCPPNCTPDYSGRFNSCPRCSCEEKPAMQLVKTTPVPENHHDMVISLKPCEAVICGGMCQVVHMPNTCPKCLCKDTCPMLDCAPTCIPDYSGKQTLCPRCHCKPPIAEEGFASIDINQCPTVKCHSYCHMGTGSDGCPACVCEDPCPPYHPCDNPCRIVLHGTNEKCPSCVCDSPVAWRSAVSANPLVPVPVNNCPPLVCPPECIVDTVGNSKCPVCLCEDIKVLMVVPQCKPVLCGGFCQEVAKIDGCTKCICSELCPFVVCANTCEIDYSGRQTKCPRCLCPQVKVVEIAAVCKPVKCGGYCHESTDENGCPKCVCSEKCTDVTCSPGCQTDYSGVHSKCPRCVCSRGTELNSACEKVVCGGLCEAMYQPNGCSKCHCSDECGVVDCPLGCVVDYSGRYGDCPRCDCRIPTAGLPKPCKPVICGGLCTEIHVRGCPQCVCSPSCPVIVCDPNCLSDYSGRVSKCPICDCQAVLENRKCPYIRCGGLCSQVEVAFGCPVCRCSHRCPKIYCSKKCKIDYSGVVSSCPRCVCGADADASICPVAKCGSRCQALRDVFGCLRCICRKKCPPVHCRGNCKVDYSGAPKKCPRCVCHQVLAQVPGSRNHDLCPLIRCGGKCKLVRNGAACPKCRCSRQCVPLICASTCQIDYSGTYSECPRCVCPKATVKGLDVKCSPVHCGGLCYEVKPANECAKCSCADVCPEVACSHNCEVDYSGLLSQCPRCICNVKGQEVITNCKPTKCGGMCTEVMGDDNCERCSCTDACPVVTCPSDCVPDYSGQTTHCPKCVCQKPLPENMTPDDTGGVDTTIEVAAASTVKCAVLVCGGMCKEERAFDGCTKCVCSEACIPLACPKNCKIDYSGELTKCPRCMCQEVKVLPVAGRCEAVKCGGACIEVKDKDGCPKCVCNTCSFVACDQSCSVDYSGAHSQCPRCVCDVKAVKDPTKCVPLKCGGFCTEVKGNDGCPKCICSDLCPAESCSKSCKQDFSGTLTKCPRCVCQEKESANDCETVVCGGFCKKVIGEDGCPSCLCSSCPPLKCPPSCRTDFSETSGTCPKCICTSANDIPNDVVLNSGSRVNRLRNTGVLMPEDNSNESDESTDWGSDQDQNSAEIDWNKLYPSDIALNSPGSKCSQLKCPFYCRTEVTFGPCGRCVCPLQGTAPVGGIRCTALRCSATCRTDYTFQPCGRCVCKNKPLAVVPAAPVMESKCPITRCSYPCRLDYSTPPCARCMCPKKIVELQGKCMPLQCGFSCTPDYSFAPCGRCICKGKKQAGLESKCPPLRCGKACRIEYSYPPCGRCVCKGSIPKPLEGWSKCQPLRCPYYCTLDYSTPPCGRCLCNKKPIVMESKCPPLRCSPSCEIDYVVNPCGRCACMAKKTQLVATENKCAPLHCDYFCRADYSVGPCGHCVCDEVKDVEDLDEMCPEVNCGYLCIEVLDIHGCRSCMCDPNCVIPTCNAGCVLDYTTIPCPTCNCNQK